MNNIFHVRSNLFKFSQFTHESILFRYLKIIWYYFADKPDFHWKAKFFKFEDFFYIYQQKEEKPLFYQEKVFIITGFRTIVFIFIVISTRFPLICPPAFFRCLLNSGTYVELRTTSLIKSTGVTCSDSFNHNRVQVLRIPVLLLACSQDWTWNLQMIVSLEA